MHHIYYPSFYNFLKDSEHQLFPIWCTEKILYILYAILQFDRICYVLSLHKKYQLNWAYMWMFHILNIHQLFVFSLIFVRNLHFLNLTFWFDCQVFLDLCHRYSYLLIFIMNLQYLIWINYFHYYHCLNYHHPHLFLIQFLNHLILFQIHFLHLSFLFKLISWQLIFCSWCLVVSRLINLLKCPSAFIINL